MIDIRRLYPLLADVSQKNGFLYFHVISITTLTCESFLKFLFICFSVVKEAAIESKKAGEKGITPRSVKKVTPVSTKAHCPCFRQRMQELTNNL